MNSDRYPRREFLQRGAVRLVENPTAADLVLVDGDPLRNIGDALKIVGVVRNGRFFSVSGLIDRAADAKATKTVE